MPGAIFHLHQFERLDGALAPFAGRQTAVNHRQLDVLEHIELGQQIEELKHEPDLSVPDAGQLARRGVLDHGPVELDRAAGGRVEATQDVHQRGFAAARRADDGDEFTLQDVERHVVQRANLLAAQMINFADAAKLNQGHDT